MRTQGRQGLHLRRTLGRATAAVLVASAFLAAPSGAGAVIADAGCAGPGDTPPQIARTGDQREAQTFTPARTGTLTRVTVPIVTPGNPLFLEQGDFSVQLLLTDSAGAPAIDVLASQTVPSASVSAGSATLDVTFAQPPQVAAGHLYAILVGRPGTLTSFAPAARSGNRCGGAAFWTSGPNHAYAAEAPGTDMVFQTYVQPSNKFSIFGKKGRLYARVPGSGHLIVDDPPGGKGKHKKRAAAAKRRNYVKHNEATATSAGDTLIRLRLTRSAVRRVLATRKLNLHVGITYTPDGGEPNLQQFTLRIRI